MTLRSVAMGCLLAALALPPAASAIDSEPASPTPTVTATPTHVPTQTPSTQDLSGFHDFSFTRNPALGFCPPLHAVYAASIHQDSGPQYRLQLSTLEEGQEGIDDCVAEYMGEPPCVVARALPERQLTGAETGQVRDVFSRVQVYNQRDIICERIAVDPCIIHEVDWDDVHLTDYVCSGAPRVASPQVSAIVALLEGLRSVASTCTGDCDSGGTVGEDELVRGVNIALGSADLSECPSFDDNHDGAVTVDELVKAVRNALSDCAG